MAHSVLKSNRPTLLFIHGLGDSSISYDNFLRSQQLSDFNLLIPDLLGHGRSSEASDYSFQHQTNGIIQQLNYLQNKLNSKLTNLILVAHSMGSIHATLLCESSLKQHIKGFINVEGSITQYGSFVSESAVKAVDENRFSSWLNEFKQTTIYQKSAASLPLRRYYASLLFCNDDAFLQNAAEMRALSLSLPGKFSHLIGKKYAELALPRIYCYGDTLAKETLNFLDENKLDKKHFPCPNHFVMTECETDFIFFLKEYVKTIMPH